MNAAGNLRLTIRWRMPGRSTLAAVASSLLAFAVPAQATEALTPQQIAAQWVGKTLIGKTAAGAALTLRLHPDGTAQLVAGNTRDSGRWRLSDTGYCAAWTHIRRGEEACFTVQQDGAAYRAYFPDGRLSAEVRVE